MKRAAGFTLIELLLALGVLAALMVVSFYLYREVNFHRAVSMETRNINTVVASISSQAASLGSTTFLTATPGVRSTWSMNLPVCQGGWCNAFGQTTQTSYVSCGSASSNGANVRWNGFAITMKNLDQRTCTAMLTNLGGATPPLVGFQTNGTGPVKYVVLCGPTENGCTAAGFKTVGSPFQTPKPCNGDYKTPVSIEAALAICSDADDERNNFVLTYFPARGTKASP